MRYLTEDCKVSIATTTTNGAAGAAEINGASLDMAGFDGVLVIVPVGAIVSGAATSIKMQQSADSAGSPDDWSDIAGTSQTIVDTADDKTFYIDCLRPTKRYVRVDVLRATQNSTFGGITYVQYKARSRPPTQGTNVSGETFNCAAEGTA